MAKSNEKKAAAGAAKGASADAAAKIVQDITNRYRVTAREARDIVTAVGNIATRGMYPQEPAAKGPLGKNLVKQVKETVTAAKTGKKGTTSDVIGKAIPKSEGGRPGDVTLGYTKGKKRK